MPGSERGGSFVAAGAVLSAGLASMCCILPIGLGAAGLSSTLVAAFFEPFRPYLLAMTALLVGWGFHLALRAPRAAEACATESGRLSRLSKPTLWASAITALALALFPSIAGLASGDPDILAAQVDSEVVVLRVDGMTCEACTPAVRRELLDVPGVMDAAVSYEQETADVRVRAERPPQPRALLEAVERAGYSAEVISR